MRAPSLLLLALAAAAIAMPERPRATFEDPHALDGWRAALATQKAGTATHPLRVSYFGDSLTADDHLTHALRAKLQALLGDGGPGFVFAMPPHPFCQHRAVARFVSDEWVAHAISALVPPDRMLGLGGSADTDTGGVLRFTPAAAVRSIDVHYLAQPHGGTFELVADGKQIARVATAADHKQAAFESAELPEGTNKIELRARGKLRVYGATLEAGSGAVVDNLGVVNATAKGMRTNNAEDHLREQLAHRAPDLVIVMYGANEAEWLRANSPGMTEHEKLFGELLATIREANPGASCLVVSPLDQLDWRDDKTPARESIPAMVAAQRRAAASAGCAFWDAYAWMGGKGASAAWHRRGLMAKDFQHPTSEGAELIADALYRGLVP